MAAKPRLNVRFDGAVLAKLEAEVARRKTKGKPTDGAAPSVTGLMQELCRAGLGMPPVAEGGTSSIRGATGPEGAGRTRARPKRPAASRGPTKAERDKAAAAERVAAKLKTASVAAQRRSEVQVVHRPSCRCPVCKPTKGKK